MVDAEVLREQSMLGADVVVKQDFGERFQIWVIGRRRGLAIAEEGGDDYEVFLGIQGLVFAN